MRASRLLQILLLLQNRGRMTCGQLARELEVSSRTILRDVDALTEAGLPVIVFQGNQGGIELGFNYRTRLTGLAADEAEAIGILLGIELPALAMLGLDQAAIRARRKLFESFPDAVRAAIDLAQHRFRIDALGPMQPDQRIPALAQAIRDRKAVRINARSKIPRTIEPIGLAWDGSQWEVRDGLSGESIALPDWGDINISAKRGGSR